MYRGVEYINETPARHPMDTVQLIHTRENATIYNVTQRTNALVKDLTKRSAPFAKKFKTGDGSTISLRERRGEFWNAPLCQKIAERKTRKPMRCKGRDYATRKADKLWATIIHARGFCAVGTAFCAGPLEAHHARGRLRAYRWRTDCGMLLCAYHHRYSTTSSAHGAPAAFKEWLQEHHPKILNARYEPETASQAIERLNKETP